MSENITAYVKIRLSISNRVHTNSKDIINLLHRCYCKLKPEQPGLEITETEIEGVEVTAPFKEFDNEVHHVVSPTGCVHYADYRSGQYVTTLCNHTNYYETCGNLHKWESTNKPVTCKRCLKLANRYNLKFKAIYDKIT